MTNKDSLLDIHKTFSEEIRHTATIVWQFSIAILTLQGGAIGLSGQNGFDQGLGRVVLTAAFLVSVALSLMLLRQARERSGFIDRIKAVEADLSKTYSYFSIPIPTILSCFKSEVLAWLLVGESVTGFIVFICHITCSSQN